ncbi:MAG: tyrosine-type recombinase/integrase [Deltaproteobacteria bacterium]|nr:tyrosine-type recombinase/integrase [Deltaproteobacteria bacterium]
MPNKRIALENGHQSGSADDTMGRKSALTNLPKWTREIQPFLQNQLSDNTRIAYENDLKQFLLFLNGRVSPEKFISLEPEHIILYRKCLEEGRLGSKPMQKSTINRKLAVVKSFFTWLKANRLLENNPADLVKSFPQTQESALKGLSDQEARRILDIPSLNSRTGALHSAILHCLLYLGLRKGELTDLKMGDLDFERGVPVIKVRGKGHRLRILPLTVPVRLALDRYFEKCSRDKSDKEASLFVATKDNRTPNAGRPLYPNAITYIVIRYAKKAGVLKRISPHSCRATCISNALDRRATHRSVQHLAGWTTPLMIQRYDKRREDLHNSAAFAIDYGSVAQAS